MKSPAGVLRAAAVAVVVLKALPAAAAVTYVGGDATNPLTWASKNNWSTGATVTGSNAALFDDAGYAGLNGAALTTGANQAALQLDFGDNSGDTLTASFSLSDNTITLAKNGSGSNPIGILRNASGTQTINSNLALGKTQNWSLAGGGSLVVNGTIGDGGSGFGLTKSGGGTLEINNANTFAGTFTLQGGTVLLDNAAGLGAGTDAVQLNAAGTSNATLTLANGVTLDRNIAVQANAAGNTYTLGVASGGTATFAGGVTLGAGLAVNAVVGSTLNLSGNIVDGAVAGTVDKVSAGTVVVSGNNTFSGAFTARGGTTIVASNTALGTAATALVSGVSATNAAALLTNGGITLAKNVTVQSSVNTLGPTGGAQQFGATLGLAPGQVAATWSGNVALNQATNLTGAAAGTVTFSGNIADGTGGTNSTGAAYAFVSSDLTKIDTGTVELNGQNTYTGTTTVQAGTLRINGASTGRGAYAVLSGATLGGRGSIVTGTGAAGLRLANDGTLSPGTAAAAGAFGVTGDVTLDGTLGLRVADAATDSLTDAGTLTIGSDATLALSATGPLTAAAYVLASYTNLSGTWTNVAGLPSGYVLNYNYGTGNQIALVSSTVPEPALIGLLTGPAVLLLGRRRAGR